MTHRAWIADDLPDIPWDDDASLQRGDAWSSTEGDKDYPNVTNPIGFMRRKPRVRVKAWTMPIVKP
jgi:hypothetical protein